MAYVRGPVTSIDSSPTLIPCNLSVLEAGAAEGKDAGEESAVFGVIHKHFATTGQFGSSAHKLVSYGKLEEKSPSAYLTQVSDSMDPAALLAYHDLIQVRWCQMESSLVVLVLTSYKGFQVH